jgi:TonB family protein
VEVAVDTDKDGNVTNVRLLRSSGNRELDEAHLRQAREWKLKPSEGGRQGVAIATEYVIKGSRRYREVQERKRAREREQQRNEQPVAARMNTAEQISSFRQRLQATSGNNTDVPTSSRRRLVETPSQQTATSRSTQSSFSRQSQTQTEETVSRRRSLVESLRRNRKNSVESNSAKTSQATSNRGRRRREQPESNNSSAERLRNALRNSRLRSAPSVTAPAAPSQGSDE